MDATLDNTQSNALAQALFPEQDSLLAPLPGPSLAGRDLDGSLELNALEVTCAEPEEAVVQGVERADTRNWREIRQQACRLLGESKDLRVAVQLSRALMQLEGVPGFCAGICFMTALAQRYWSELYPALDPEDRDPTMRINAIQELVSEPIIAQFRVARLFSGSRFVKVTGNDLLLATSAPLARPHLARAPAHEAFAAIEALGVEAIRDHVRLLRATREQLRSLSALVFQQTGLPLQLGALTSSQSDHPGVLDAVCDTLERELERFSQALADADADTLALEPSASDIPRDSRRSAGEIGRREDVVMLLDRICAYYARVEPSSPVPLLLQRAKRVAMMDFLEIVRDLADQGLPQIGTIAGIPVE